ncbi:hypothetical protein DYH09_23345 [bacterium CPR1]|nr:hypothetical protein [bacterium CPR1]
MRSRGVALITALMFMMFLLVVGLTFVTLMEQDYRFAAQQERSQRAYFLAQAGIDFYRARASFFTVDTPVELGVPAGNTQNVFEVVLQADGTIRSRGMIKDAYGGVKADRVIVVPQGNFQRAYDAGSSASSSPTPTATPTTS